MSRTVLSGGTVVTLNDRDDIFPDGVVACEAGGITYAGPASEFSLLSGDQVIDAGDHLVLPGLVNVHTHTAMTYQRGLIEDLTPRQWFARTAALEAQMSEEDLYWSALL
ncbi:MAG: amidohydrolase family protein, partial [bacterium]